MKNETFARALLIVTCYLLAPVSANAVSLLEVYQQALQSDPRIHEAEALRLAALEAEPQARGFLMPQISLSGSWGSDNSERISTQQLPLPPPNDEFVATREDDYEATRWTVDLTQTVFRWDQIVNLRRADKIVARAEADREAAQQDLIVRVAQNYFGVLAAEDRLTSTHAYRQAIARQLEQAKQRFDVGLIAITDVQESQAAYDQAVADEIAAKRILATAREFLREITGEYVRELSAPGEELPLESPDPETEQAWVELALSQNLALVSSRVSERLARDEISYRRNGHYPTIDLYVSLRDEDASGEQRTIYGPKIPPLPEFTPATNEVRSDSIGIQLNVPIFSGGYTSSRVREAVYLHRAAREQLQRVTRETERATRDAYLGVLSEMSRVKALEQAVQSSRTALEATDAGFDVGTRTIVDVLDSQFNLYRAITLFYQARYDYLLNVLRLKQAAGTLRVEDLEDIDQWLGERPTPEEAFAREEAQAAQES